MKKKSKNIEKKIKKTKPSTHARTRTHEVLQDCIKLEDLTNYMATFGKTTTADRKAFFLCAYRLTMTITQACIVAQINYSTYRDWLDNDKDFAVGCSQAKYGRDDFVKTKMFKRISDGSDYLIKFYLETQLKDEFTSRQEITGKDGKDFIPKMDLSKLTNKELVQLHSIYEKATANET
jgi:hypothetical protein